MVRSGRCAGLGALLGLTAAIACLAEESSLLPLDTGSSRFYRTQRKYTITTNGAAGKQSFPLEVTGDVVERVTGSDTGLFGEAVVVLESRATETNAMGQVRNMTTTTYLSVRPDGIYLAGVRSAAAAGAASGELSKYTTPLLWLKLPLQPGTRWDVGKLKLDTSEAVTTAEVAGTEDVSVPAGTYRGCTRILCRHSQLTGELSLGGARATIESGQGTTTIWLAPGIGPVREKTELTGNYLIRPPNQPGVEIKAEVTSQKTRDLTKVEKASP